MSGSLDRMEELAEAASEPPETTGGPTSTRLGALLTSLSRMRTIVGLTAGAISITGAILSYTGYSKPVVAGTGTLVAVVHDRHDAYVGDAVVEVLTPEKAVVTTLAADSRGRASVPIAPGAYIIQVRHPRLGTATRAVEIQTGLTAEVRVSLPGSLSAGAAIPFTRAGAGPTAVRPAARAAASTAAPARRAPVPPHATPMNPAPAASPAIEARPGSARPAATNRGGGQAP